MFRVWFVGTDRALKGILIFDDAELCVGELLTVLEGYVEVQYDRWLNITILLIPSCLSGCVLNRNTFDF